MRWRTGGNYSCRRGFTTGAPDEHFEGCGVAMIRILVVEDHEIVRDALAGAPRRGARHGGGRRGLHRRGGDNGSSSSTVPTSCWRICRWATAARWTSSGGSGARGWTRASSSSPASATPSRPSRRCRTARWATCSRRNRRPTCWSPFARWRAVSPTSRLKSPRSCPRRRSVGDRCASSAAGASSRCRAASARSFLQAVDGYATSEIARRLCISPKTVESHRTKINRKLAVRTTADLVRFAVAHGIVVAPRAPDAPERGPTCTAI